MNARVGTRACPQRGTGSLGITHACARRSACASRTKSPLPTCPARPHARARAIPLPLPAAASATRLRRPERVHLPGRQPGPARLSSCHSSTAAAPPSECPHTTSRRAPRTSKPSRSASASASAYAAKPACTCPSVCVHGARA